MSAEPVTAGRGSAAWLRTRERGSTALLRLELWLLRKLGRRGMRWSLYPIAIYFWATAGEARKASRAYLERIAAHPTGRASLGGDPSWRHTWRHVFAFAEATLDRVALFAGCGDDLQVEIHGQSLLESVRRDGAVLLGAHLGSFELLRAAAEDFDIPVNVLMYTDNAQRITSLLDELDPDNRVRVIGIEPGSVRASFEVKACLERGEFVAVLADRVGLDSRERAHSVSFLGERARLPEGPFLLPIVLRSPARLLVAVKTGRDKYEIFAEPHAEAGEGVPRSERRKLIEERMQAYASRLEHYCLRYPYQWFNFYDFWAAEQEPSAPLTSSEEVASHE